MANRIKYSISTVVPNTKIHRNYYLERFQLSFPCVTLSGISDGLVHPGEKYLK